MDFPNRTKFKLVNYIQKLFRNLFDLKSILERNFTGFLDSETSSE